MPLNDKIKSAVMSGADIGAKQALKVLRADLNRLLSDYFMFDSRDLEVEADLTKKGGVAIVISLNAESFKEAGKILD